MSIRIICQTDNSFKSKSEDEFWSIICLYILRGLHDGCDGVEEPCGSLNRGKRNIELLPNTWRRALDITVYQRRISPVERMLNRENNDLHVNLFSCESHSR